MATKMAKLSSEHDSQQTFFITFCVAFNSSQSHSYTPSLHASNVIILVIHGPFCPKKVYFALLSPICKAHLDCLLEFFMVHVIDSPVDHFKETIFIKVSGARPYV